MTQRRPAPRQMRTRSTLVASPREKVLARRRMALVGLVVLVVATLVAALYTGSVLFLGINLALDVIFALYIAVLLQIKQRQQRRPKWTLEPEEDVKVV